MRRWRCPRRRAADGIHPKQDMSRRLHLGESLALAAVTLRPRVDVRAQPDPLRLDLPPVGFAGRTALPDASTLRVQAALYLYAELEEAAVVAVAEVLAVNRTSLPVRSAAAAGKLEAFSRNMPRWYDRAQRASLFARLFGGGAAASNDQGALINRDFQRALAAFCLALFASGGATSWARRSTASEAHVAQAALDLLGNLGTRQFGNSIVAARVVHEQLAAAFDLLNDPALQAAFSVRGLWALLVVIIGDPCARLRPPAAPRSGRSTHPRLARRGAAAADRRVRATTVHPAKRPDPGVGDGMAGCDGTVARPAAGRGRRVTPGVAALPPPLRGPFATPLGAAGLHPTVATIGLVRSQVQALLDSTDAFHALPDAARRRMSARLTHIAAYAAECAREVWGQSEKLRQRPVLRERVVREGPLAQAVAAAPAPARPGAVNQVARITQETVRAIAFPVFVADLIKGTFNAIIQANIQQLEQFGQLLENVTKTVDQFMGDNISDSQARDWLQQRFPDHIRVRDGKATAADGADERAVPDFQRDLNLSGGASLDDDSIEDTLVPAARRRIAESRLQMLSTMVLMGVNRIVVTGGQDSRDDGLSYRCDRSLASRARDRHRLPRRGGRKLRLGPMVRVGLHLVLVCQLDARHQRLGHPRRHRSDRRGGDSFQERLLPGRALRQRREDRPDSIEHTGAGGQPAGRQASGRRRDRRVSIPAHDPATRDGAGVCADWQPAARGARPGGAGQTAGRAARRRASGFDLARPRCEGREGRRRRGARSETRDARGEGASSRSEG